MVILGQEVPRPPSMVVDQSGAYVGAVAAGVIDVVPILTDMDMGISRFSRLRPAERHGLTFRQLEYLELASYGMTLEQSATALNVATKSVENHRTRIIKQVGARSMPHAVRIGFESGLLVPAPEPYKFEGEHKLTMGQLLELDRASYGYMISETAKWRGVTVKSAEQARSRAIHKLDANNITHAVRRGIESGILAVEGMSFS